MRPRRLSERSEAWKKVEHGRNPALIEAIELPNRVQNAAEDGLAFFSG